MAKRVSKDARANKAATVRAAARATAKFEEKESKTEANISLKQVIVGFVIACFASVLLAFYASDFFLLLMPSYKYEPYSPKNVFVYLEATSTKAVDYEVYYTVAPETWYNEDNVMRIKGKSGMHGYVFSLPVDRIYNLRIDFGENPESILVSNIRLFGTQSMYLSDFSKYQYNQFDQRSITSNGQLFFVSHGDDPFMAYEDDF